MKDTLEKLKNYKNLLEIYHKNLKKRNILFGYVYYFNTKRNLPNEL